MGAGFVVVSEVVASVREVAGPPNQFEEWWSRLEVAHLG